MPNELHTPQSRRFESIDVLRGVTVLGILIMNVQLFAMISTGFGNPYGCSWTDTPNVITWVIIQIVYGYKDLLIFGMLFGVGISIMDERDSRVGRNLTRLHYRRMAVLFLFGLMHAYLIWPGDILYAYAICGCVVFLLRRQPIAFQLIAGALVYAIPMALLYIAGLLLQKLDPKDTVEIYSTFTPTIEQIAAHNASYRAGWIGQMAPRATEAFAAHVGLFPLGIFWLSSGSMLAGMGLYRCGMFTLGFATRTYVTLMAIAMIVGLPLILYGLQRNFDVNWEPQYSIALGRIYFFAAAPFTSLGYISFIMLICRSGWIKWLTRRLSAVGQMALTNYIMQSLICSILFYGHGFGLVGQVDRIGQMVIVAAVWLLQIVVSPIWLRHFRFGPMEWLWRSLSYGVKQPMRLSTISESDVSSYTPLAAVPPIIQDPSTQRSARKMRTIWKLAALIGMIVPGLVVANIFQFFAQILAGVLIGRVVLFLLATGVMLLATRFCIKRFDRLPLSAVGIGYDRPWIVHLFSGIALGTLLVTVCWLSLLVLGNARSTFPLKAPVLPGLRMALGIIFTLSLCFYEELLCRGYALQIIGRWNLKLAIIITGLLFVSIHFFNPGGLTPTAILNMAFFHLLMTVVYLRTRSLWLPIGIHTGWNFTLGYVFGLPVSGVTYKGAILVTEWTPNLFTGNDFGPEGGLLVTLILLIVISAVWWLIGQRNQQPDLLTIGHGE